jgi:hypothetical protein
MWHGVGEILPSSLLIPFKFCFTDGPEYMFDISRWAFLCKKRFMIEWMSADPEVIYS